MFSLKTRLPCSRYQIIVQWMVGLLMLGGELSRALMVNTRYPVLNIIDAIWINPVPLNGPSTPYTVASQMNVITASTDSVALDYWSVKHILCQNWENRAGEVSASMNPDNADPGFFGDWLRLSMEEILLGGNYVNIDESYMSVYIAENE